jgi:Domain of unknown function (DUF4258)
MPNALVTYSEHAMRRMQERGIPQRQGELTLANPDRVFIGVQGKPIAERMFNSGTIRVVYIDRLDPAGWHRHVITVMWR